MIYKVDLNILYFETSIRDGGSYLSLTPDKCGVSFKKEMEDKYLWHFKRNRVCITDHDRFVIGWQYGDKNIDIFDLVVFPPPDLEARISPANNLLPKDVELLESKGVIFFQDTYQYKELKKLIVLGELGS